MQKKNGNCPFFAVGGHLLSGENWRFLARFCFLSLHGRFEYDVEYEESYGVQNIDLYYDTASQWARVYGERADLTNCRQKESVLQVSQLLIWILPKRAGPACYLGVSHHADQEQVIELQP